MLQSLRINLPYLKQIGPKTLYVARLFLCRFHFFKILRQIKWYSFVFKNNHAWCLHASNTTASYLLKTRRPARAHKIEFYPVDNASKLKHYLRYMQYVLVFKCFKYMTLQHWLHVTIMHVFFLFNIIVLMHHKFLIKWVL